MKRSPLFLIALLSPVWSFAADPEIEKLKDELEALKSLYTEKIAEVETRLAAIEQREKSMQSTVSSVQREVTSVKEEVDSAQADYAVVEPLKEGAFTTGFDPNAFSFYGYMRAGYGVNDDGTSQERFQLPGSGAAYRLGNEKDTYIETAFSYYHLKADRDANSPLFGTHLMLAYSTSDKGTGTETNSSLRQIYATATNVIPSQPDATLWAGQRYYQRHDVHLNDFYWLDMSGYGGGIEGWDLGFATGSLAWIGGTNDDFTGTDNLIPEDLEDTDKNNFDIRLQDIDLGIGIVNLWLNYSHYKFDDGGSLSGSEDGFSTGVWLVNELGDKGTNTAIVQYGTGVAANFNSFSPLIRGADGKFPTGVDASDQSRLRIMDVVDYSFTENFTLQAVAIYQEDDLGVSGLSDSKWYSIGVRPVYDFTELYGIAFEAGYDYSELETGDEGGLFKFTVAPQITPDLGFFSRPSIRVFFTYATWSEEYEGQIGGTTYDDDTSGISYGVQMESWW